MATRLIECGLSVHAADNVSAFDLTCILTRVPVVWDRRDDHWHSHPIVLNFILYTITGLLRLCLLCYVLLLAGGTDPTAQGLSRGSDGHGAGPAGVGGQSICMHRCESL